MRVSRKTASPTRSISATGDKAPTSTGAIDAAGRLALRPIPTTT